VEGKDATLCEVAPVSRGFCARKSEGRLYRFLKLSCNGCQSPRNSHAARTSSGSYNASEMRLHFSPRFLCRVVPSEANPSKTVHTAARLSKLDNWRSSSLLRLPMLTGDEVIDLEWDGAECIKQPTALAVGSGALSDVAFGPQELCTHRFSTHCDSCQPPEFNMHFEMNNIWRGR
jgi:hypothetical protein